MPAVRNPFAPVKPLAFAHLQPDNLTHVDLPFVGGSLEILRRWREGEVLVFDDRVEHVRHIDCRGARPLLVGQLHPHGTAIK